MENINHSLAEEEKDFETNPVIQRLQALEENAWNEWLSEEFRILAEEADSEGHDDRLADDTPLRSLTESELDEQMAGSEGQAECSICQQPVQLNGQVTVLTCGHWFHSDGILRWLNEHRTCPMCRRTVD